jgi:hypothetical protein
MLVRGSKMERIQPDEYFPPAPSSQSVDKNWPRKYWADAHPPCPGAESVSIEDYVKVEIKDKLDEGKDKDN